MSIEVENSLLAIANVVGNNGSSAAVLVPNYGFSQGGNQLASVYIANVSIASGGASAVVRTQTPHGIPASGPPGVATFNGVFITGVLGIIGLNDAVYSNVQVLTATTFKVTAGLFFLGSYLGGGTVAAFGSSQFYSEGVISTAAGTPVTVTTSATLASLSLSTGSLVGILYTSDPTLDENYFQITQTGAQTFTLNGSSSAVSKASGRVFNFTPQGLGFVQNVTSPYNLPLVVTDTGNPTRKSGDIVRLSQVNGVPANGMFLVDVLNPTQFSLRGTVGTGAAYTGGGFVNGSFGAQQVIAGGSLTTMFDLPLDENVASNPKQGGCSFLVSGSQFIDLAGAFVAPFVVGLRPNQINQSVLRVQLGTFPGRYSVAVFRNPNAVGLGS